VAIVEYIVKDEEDKVEVEVIYAEDQTQALMGTTRLRGGASGCLAEAEGHGASNGLALGFADKLPVDVYLDVGRKKPANLNHDFVGLLIPDPILKSPSNASVQEACHLLPVDFHLQPAGPVRI